MRVCQLKSTGKLIEMQSRATEGTLIANALAAGYAEEDIEEKEVTAEEWAAILAAETAPTYADLRRAAYPPVADFLDARVKQHSLDSTIRAAGAVQEEAYLTACLEVKERFPKPQA